MKSNTYKGVGGEGKIFFGSKFPARLLVDVATSDVFGKNYSAEQARKKKVYERGHSLRNVFGIMTPLEWGRMQKENWHIVISA